MDVSLSEHLFNFTVTEFVSQVIVKRLHDDIRRIMSAREVKCHAVDVPNEYLNIINTLAYFVNFATEPQRLDAFFS